VKYGRAAWLFDIGSTFTKLAVVDLDDLSAGVRVQSPTTVASDVRVGMRRAIAAAELTGAPGFADAELRLASSSAAGGLALVVSGLVPRLSLEAGRIAALGAGAKLVGAWGYRLTPPDVAELERTRPDIVLLTGGTDGGDREVIAHNAKALTRLDRCPTVLVAGNREASDDAAELLAGAGISARVVPNIMPELDRLEVEPVREAIREVFLEEIVQAKGIDRAAELVNGEILPTPSIVLGAVERLAADLFEGSLMAVEVGGATTNVHSFSPGTPREPATVRRGFVEPDLKRTVEGDLGVRHNARTIVELSGSVEPELLRWVELLEADPARLPSSPAERELDLELAGYAMRTAVGRHAGTLKEVVLPTGPVLVQHGKDLRDVGTLLVTGGSAINAVDAQRLVRGALRGHDPLTLVPEEPRVLLDRAYGLYAGGLLVEAGLPREAAALVSGGLEELDLDEAGRTEAHALH
jgi:uncharacterized protein (TIGR01319 family)